MANRSLPKVCVILGAGASHDVWGAGSPYINPDYKPPLARDLFNIAEHGAYWGVLKWYNGAIVLTQQLAELLASEQKQIGIENELRRYAEHTDPQMRQHYKHIPAYLRDLLYLASKQYTYVPSTYVQLVIELLAEQPHDILFIVLNYDNLLEQALTLFNPDLQFRYMAEYVDVNRNAKVVKLHGSINWFRRLPGGRTTGWTELVAQLDVFKQFPEDEIIIKDGIEKVIDSADSNHLLYPLLTAPLAGKHIGDAVCPKSHIIAAQEFLKNCRKFLIIGTSGLDEDLLYLLNEAVTYKPDESNTLIHLVDVGEAADKASAKFQKGVKAFRHQLSPQNTFRDGFRVYVLQHLRDFATSSVQ